MLTGNDSVQRFDVSITYTHMRAADGSDDRWCATWLLTSMRERVKSASTAGRRGALAWRSMLSAGTCMLDLALKAQRMRSRGACHDDPAGATDWAPSTASTLGIAVTGAFAPRGAGSLALAAAEALLRRPATFMAFTWRVG